MVSKTAIIGYFELNPLNYSLRYIIYSHKDTREIQKNPTQPSCQRPVAQNPYLYTRQRLVETYSNELISEKYR